MPQFARPSSDITTTNWTRSSGTDEYWTYIDEDTADDADYVQTQNTNSGLEVKLSAVDDPASSTGHIIRVRNWMVGSAAGEARTILLLQGGTTIATLITGTLARTVGTQNNITLTGAQADAITDYSDLRLRFTATTLGSGETYRVGWAELEVPDASSGRRIFMIS
jgi:hypothetical protein